MGQKFSSCDPVPPALRAKVRIEVHQHIVNLPWLQIGQQGTITSVPENFIYVTRDSFKGLVALEIIIDLPFGFPINNIISLTLDALPATLQVTTV